MAQTRGNFPYPTAQQAEGGGVIALGQGGTWYPPSGEWIMTLPAANMVMEWWNPVQTAWQTIASASDYVSSDGTNIRLRNLTGAISIASFAAGSGGTNGIGSAGSGAVAFSAPSAGGVQATGYVIVGGSVQAPTITQAGSGFLVPPLVVIDPPPAGGIQATAVAALTAGGGIGSITMVNVGAGYAASPNFYLIPQPAYYTGAPSGGVVAAGFPPPGLIAPANAVPGNQNLSQTAGALLTSAALTGSGTVTGVVIINFGSQYTGTPTGTVTGAGAATVTLNTVTAAANLTAFFQPRVQ
jgi:hypothetical protein